VKSDSALMAKLIGSQSFIDIAWLESLASLVDISFRNELVLLFARISLRWKLGRDSSPRGWEDEINR